MTSIIDRCAELVGTRVGLNEQRGIFRLRWCQIEFGSTPNRDDWKVHAGRSHDLLVFDETTNFLQSQVMNLRTWVRSADPSQFCQTIMTFNPPTDAEGRWVIEYFAPWLDPKHSEPAQPGELRWCATIKGATVWLDNEAPFDFEGERIIPHSRTFIPARIGDNPYLDGTEYLATLQSLPEPLRSQMLYGDFAAGMSDDAMQVVPTAWVDAAMARWRKLDGADKPPMDSLGIDCARGGDDNEVIARRHGDWFDVPLVTPGREMVNDEAPGAKTAGRVVAATRDGAVQHIDVIGIGASPYDFLMQASQHVIGVNVAEAALGFDRSGRLGFANQRSEDWWRMREALEPGLSQRAIALPPDPRLRADLCAPRWRLSGKLIQVESREDIVKRIGRSPDWAAAYLLALRSTPKRGQLPKSGGALGNWGGQAHTAAGFGYDPTEHAFGLFGSRD